MSLMPPDLARIATDVLAQAPIEPRDMTPARESETIHAVQLALRKRAHMRSARRGGAIAAALAVVAAAVFLLVSTRGVSGVIAPPIAPTLVAHALSGSVVVLRAGVPVAFGPTGAPLIRDDRVLAATDGRASLQLENGTHILVESGGEIVVGSQTAIAMFDLRAGALRADVAKLAGNRRLIVRTPDAEVEVRGTSFRVSLAPPAGTCGTITRVTVSEGVVVVRGLGAETRVAAGETWPACDEPASESSKAAITSPVARSRGREISSPSRPAASGTPSKTASRTEPPALSAPVSAGADPSGTHTSASLMEQNRAFSEAMAAKRQGERRRAIAALEGFIVRFPTSPLAEDATVERMRLIGEIDREEARVTAREYLARFPNGFARRLAEALAGP